MSAPMLAIEGVSAAYGAVQALREVSISGAPGEIVTLVGANGAGKSTLLMTICGDPRARTGRILFEGRDITACRRTRSCASASRRCPRGGASSRA
jgi:branched-chain amino acid transport system ATP-binding protein